MSGRRITELTQATSVAPDDVLPMVDLTGTPTTKQVTARILIDDIPPQMAPNVRTASYTLTADDAHRAVEMDVASANTVTVPPNSAVPFPVGTLILVTQVGDGQTTIVEGSGVDVDAVAGLALPARYASVLLRKRSTNGWVATVLDIDPDAGLVTANVQTDSYTLTAADAGRAVEIDSTDPEDVTVPPESAVDFPVGTIIEVAQVGTGQVTIVEDTGVDVRTPETLVLRGQWSTVSLRKRDSDEWLLVGDVEEAS